MTHFERKYELTIGQPGQAGFVLSEHDISFSVKKTLENGKSQNKITLKIYNLSKEQKDIISSKINLVAILKAGYLNNMTTIFSGKIIKSLSKRNGCNIETVIEAGEGFIALKNCISSKSFPKNTNALTIVNALLQDIISEENDLALGTIYNQEILSNKVYKTSYAYCGNTKTELNKILNPLNMFFTIQNNIIFIAHKEQFSERQGFLINEESGLIFAEKTKGETKEKNGVNFETFLNGALSPLAIIKLENESVIGNFKVIETEHKGDFLGTDWITKCFAVEVH